MNSMYKTPMAFFLSLAFSSLTWAGDLTQDLQTPFEPMTNPFQSLTSTVSLGSDAAQGLASLLSQCAYSEVSTDSQGLQSFSEGKLRANCQSVLHLSTEGASQDFTFYDNKLIVSGAGLQLIVVAWDGSDSDGGDEQAIGIYDFSGQRIAVYPSVHADGDVLDGLAHILGVKLAEVNKKSN